MSNLYGRVSYLAQATMEGIGSFSLLSHCRTQRL